MPRIQRYPQRGLFITGTGTNVGKTYVSALVAQALRAEGVRVGVYKPAASGCRRRGGRLVAEDAQILWRAAGRPGTLAQVCPQRFAAPIAPHLAAESEGKRIDARLLRAGLSAWRDCCDLILVEGAGGLYSPLGEREYVADLAAEFGYPLVVVAANQLGTINATVQTLLAAGLRGLAVAGVVLNDVSAPLDASAATNRRELEMRCAVPLLAQVAFGGGFDRSVAWSKLAGTASRRRTVRRAGA